MPDKSLFLIAVSVLLISSLCRCKPEDVSESPPPPDTLSLAEKIAGRYFGTYSCGTYDGQSYGSFTGFDTLELVAVGRDTLQLVRSVGCVLDYWSYVQDTTIAPGTDHSIWVAYYRQSNAKYDHYRLSYYVANDSLIISQPEHTGGGWLGRSFYGKRN